MAIGARSQSARTYLERKLDSFPDGGRKGGERDRERERERGGEKGGKESYYFFLFLLYVYLASLDELIGHGLLALRECLPSDSELTSKVILSCNADPALIIIIVFYFLL